MTPAEIRAKLATAAGQIRGYSLSEPEKDKLYRDYEQETGRPRERVVKAIGKAINLTPDNVEKRASASNDTDRIIRELEGVTRPW